MTALLTTEAGRDVFHSLPVAPEALLVRTGIAIDR